MPDYCRSIHLYKDGMCILVPSIVETISCDDCLFSVNGDDCNRFFEMEPGPLLPSCLGVTTMLYRRLEVRNNA